MPPRAISAKLFRRDIFGLAEGPFWHDGRLWWVDIVGGRLHSGAADGTLVDTITFGESIGSAVPAENGTFLVALKREIARLHLESKQWDTIVLLDDLPEGTRFNDGKCDPKGRLLVGTFSPENRKTSALYSLHNDHSFRPVRQGISISNGLAWSEDGKTMYFIDTPSLSVFAYDYDVDTGAMIRERIVLRFPEKDGWPDGMTIDREGRLWIAFWDGWSVRCYQPATGECEAIVPIPCSQVSSCCFGGPGLDQLFITTARDGLKDNDLEKQPLAGSLFTCDPGTSGFPTSHHRHEPAQASA